MKVCSLYLVTSRTSIVWNILAGLISHPYYQQIQGILAYMDGSCCHALYANTLVVLISQIKLRATIPLKPCRMQGSSHSFSTLHFLLSYPF
jgi:hypothetical protein